MVTVTISLKREGNPGGNKAKEGCAESPVIREVRIKEDQLGIPLVPLG